MVHPLTGPDNDGSTPLFVASEAPPVRIRSTMAPSFPKSNKTSLSPFLLSKGVCDAGKHEKNGAKKVHQMMPRASNDALGRIDTTRHPGRGKCLPDFLKRLPLPRRAVGQPTHLGLAVGNRCEVDELVEEAPTGSYSASADGADSGRISIPPVRR